MHPPNILLWSLEPEVSEDTVTLGAQGHLALLAFHSHYLCGPLPASVTSQLTLALPPTKPPPSTAPERQAHWPKPQTGALQPLQQSPTSEETRSRDVRHQHACTPQPAAFRGGENLSLAKNCP